MCYTGARQNLGDPGSSKTHIRALSGEIHTEKPVSDYRCYPVQRNWAGGYQPFASALFTPPFVLGGAGSTVGLAAFRAALLDFHRGMKSIRYNKGKAAAVQHHATPWHQIPGYPLNLQWPHYHSASEHTVMPLWAVLLEARV